MRRLTTYKVYCYFHIIECSGMTEMRTTKLSCNVNTKTNCGNLEISNAELICKWCISTDDNPEETVVR